MLFKNNKNNILKANLFRNDNIKRFAIVISSYKFFIYCNFIFIKTMRICIRNLNTAQNMIFPPSGFKQVFCFTKEAAFQNNHYSTSEDIYLTFTTTSLFCNNTNDAVEINFFFQFQIL